VSIKSPGEACSIPKVVLPAVSKVNVVSANVAELASNPAVHRRVPATLLNNVFFILIPLENRVVVIRSSVAYEVSSGDIANYYFLWPIENINFSLLLTLQI
jgi:hypothetical protein